MEPERSSSRGRESFQKIQASISDAHFRVDETDTLVCQVIMEATREGVSVFKSFCLLLIPFVLVLIQLLLMSSFNSASADVPCSNLNGQVTESSHKSCRLGEYCEPCKGFCMDCITSNFSAAILDPAVHQTIVDYCAATDVLPARCDHLVTHLNEATFFDRFSIVIMSFLLAGAMAKDMDEVTDAANQRLPSVPSASLTRLSLSLSLFHPHSLTHSLCVCARARACVCFQQAITEHVIMMHRARKLSSTHQAMTSMFGWLLYRLRAYVLPFYIIGAVTSMVVFGRMIITKVLVDFLAIAFVLEMDDVLKIVFLHPEAGKGSKAVVQALNDEGLRLGWFSSRVYIICQTIFLATFIIGIEGYMELVMSVWGTSAETLAVALHTLERMGITSATHRIAPCSVILNTLNSVVLVASCGGSFFHALYVLVSSWRSLKWPQRRLGLLDLIMSPLICFGFFYSLMEVHLSDRAKEEGCAIDSSLLSAISINAGGHGHGSH
jgi:hypothetical protein